MPIRRDLYEQMIAEREAAEVEASRGRRWYAVRTVLLCIMWQLLPCAMTVYAFHGIMPQDRALGLLDAAVGLAAAGTLLIIVVRHRRLREGSD